jgi:hypothetical protein
MNMTLVCYDRLFGSILLQHYNLIQHDLEIHMNLCCISFYIVYGSCSVSINTVKWDY